jgi:ubiquinone/menaquinone biosynthesis C-methylase UbiE
MADIPDRATFENLYAGQAPWDIDGPQQPFVDAADQITGKVLDAGCGTGETALYLAGQGRQVTGIDFLDFPIGQAQKKAAKRGLSATFLVKDATRLLDWNERFDNVIDSGLFHVFSDEDRTKYVAGLAHVLKPGGRVFLMCFSDQEPPGFGPRRITQQELRDAFATGWFGESIRHCRFAVIPQYRQEFPEGAKSWFAVVRRE